MVAFVVAFVVVVVVVVVMVEGKMLTKVKERPLPTLSGVV